MYDIPLIEIQRQLNRLAGTPYAHPGFLDWLNDALHSELAEVRDEFKPEWKWWKRNDQVLSAQVNLGKVRTEIADLHFFMMSAVLWQWEVGPTRLEMRSPVALRTSFRTVAPEFRYQVARQRTRDLSQVLNRPDWEQHLPEALSALWALTVQFFDSPEQFEAEYLLKALVNLERWGATETGAELIRNTHERLIELGKPEVSI